MDPMIGLWIFVGYCGLSLLAMIALLIADIVRIKRGGYPLKWQ